MAIPFLLIRITPIIEIKFSSWMMITQIRPPPSPVPRLGILRGFFITTASPNHVKIVLHISFIIPSYSHLMIRGKRSDCLDLRPPARHMLIRDDAWEDLAASSPIHVPHSYDPTSASLHHHHELRFDDSWAPTITPQNIQAVPACCP